MTREEIISGLKFTIEMFLFDPSTGETITGPRNDMDKTTIDACRGAIKLLEQEPCGDCISREAAINAMRELPHEYRNAEQRARTGGIAACQVIVEELPSVSTKKML